MEIKREYSNLSYKQNIYTIDRQQEIQLKEKLRPVVYPGYQ